MIHRLGLGPCVDSEESEVPIYVRALDTCFRQTPLSIQVDLAWLLTADYKVTINKVAAVESTVWDEDLVDKGLLLNVGAHTEKVQAPCTVYIPWCLTPALINGVQSPH